MKFIHHPRRRSNDDNLIPLINVVFLMLIFFMVAGRIAPTDVFQIEPPTSKSEIALKPESIRVLVSSDGRLAVNSEPVIADNLAATLAQQLNAAPAHAAAGNNADQSATITLKADASINAQQLHTVLNALRAAGSRKVILLTTRGG